MKSGKPFDELQLIKKMAEGDMNSFDAIYWKYYFFGELAKLELEIHDLSSQMAVAFDPSDEVVAKNGGAPAPMRGDMRQCGAVAVTPRRIPAFLVGLSTSSAKIICANARFAR